MISGRILLIFELSSASRVGLKKSGAKILNINEVTAIRKESATFFSEFTTRGRYNFNATDVIFAA